MYEKAYFINRHTSVIRHIVVQSYSVNRNKPQIRQRKNRTRSIWREVHKTIKMVLRKYDTANSEQFVTPIRGLYSEHVISVEDFKDCNVELMKNRWIDTTHGNKGEKIYELFDPDTDGEIVKESMQEWLCDNRHQITECISIALRNHEFTYAEWFKYVDVQSGPDELALYSLARKYGIHTSVYNKSYVWTTLMNHISRTDEEIFKLSGINLV